METEKGTLKRKVPFWVVVLCLATSAFLGVRIGQVINQNRLDRMSYEQTTELVRKARLEAHR
jgi:hypothetical protein